MITNSVKFMNIQSTKQKNSKIGMPTPSEKCCSCIPQRWITVTMCSLALLNAYNMRVCLSIAITEIVVPPSERIESINDTNQFQNDSSDLQFSNGSLSNGGKYDWDEHTQGLVLSSFYWGYFITNIVGGVIADKFGGRHTLGLSILFSAILTLLTPASVQWGGANGLIIVRALMGIGEGATFPAVNVLLARWIPATERAWFGSLAFSGMALGSVIGTAVSGIILHYLGSWQAVFYVFGGSAVLSYLLIWLLCYSRPSESPFISEFETRYLQEKLKNTNTEVPPTPWCYILCSKPVWALVIVSFGKSWGFITVLSDMPKYMKSVLNFSVNNNGFLSSIGPLGYFIFGSISSRIADKLVEKDLISAIRVRKIGSTISTVGSGIFLVLGSYAGCNATFAVVLQTIGVTLFGAAYFSININTLDLAPNFAGTILGIVFGLSNTSGFLAPYIAGVLAPNQTLNEWRLVFWTALVIFTVSNMAFLIFGSADVQEWNNPGFPKKKKTKNKSGLKENIELLSVQLSRIEEE